MGINPFRATIGAAALFVAWRTGLLQSVLLLPFTIVRGVLSPLVSRPELRDADSIAGAVLNVTTDHKQMAELIGDFLRSPGIDPLVEEHFRAFLARQRIRSFPRLETALDWLLQLYWIILPIVVFSMVCNMTTKKGVGDNTPPSSPVAPALQQLSYGSRRAGSVGGIREDGVISSSLGCVQQGSQQPLPLPQQSGSSGALACAPNTAMLGPDGGRGRSSGRTKKSS